MYNGIKELFVSDQFIADIFEQNVDLELLDNQYFIGKRESGEIAVLACMEDGKNKEVKYKTIHDNILGDIKPRNNRQRLLFDLLSKNIPVVSICGPAGSGKTYISMCYALQELQNNRINKIIVVRNEVSMRGVRDIGALPGTATEKLKNSCLYISDIIGDYKFEEFLYKEKIEIAYLGNMRSRSFDNCVILCNEAQNMSKELVSMMVSRVGQNTKLIFDFDLSQIDKDYFYRDNGVSALNESLKGNCLFGAVELKDVERSEVAKLAALIK